MSVAPLRLQAMILKVSGFDLKVEYLPGIKQILADTLSRASVGELPAEEDELQVNMVERISISEANYAELLQNTANELHALYTLIQVGWPETKQQVPHSIQQYWDTSDELAVLDGVIYRGVRIVIPQTMKPAMIAVIHGTHLGIVKCKQRAREALNWPGMSAQIEEKVKDCPSTPKHPQANGEAEAAVKTVKYLWRKNENKNKALLDYRATPIPGIGLSSSQLCMGRRLRTTLPMATSLPRPETYNTQEIKRSFQKAMDKQKYHYDRHVTRELPPLKPIDHVRVKPENGSKEWKASTVVQSHASPRSYAVVTGSRRIRRNRVALRADRPESHAGYQLRHAITLQQPEPEQESATPDTDTAPLGKC
ncbi:uncharacterized protein [Montipora foliosa]|uniref:uncharacterized protein n=1 Tax=Montipora foliosa TaxID=591990 RepID=UPI0035F14EB7